MHGHIQPPPSEVRPPERGSIRSSIRSSISTVKRVGDPAPSAPGALVRRRGASRLSFLLTQILLLAGGLWSLGCDHCEERFCTGIQVATVHMMELADACCTTPEAPECEGLDERFGQFIDGLHHAYMACLDGNTERLRELLEFILRTIPRIVLIAFCGEDVDLGDWLAEACHPYVNSSAVFLASDRITAQVGLVPVTRGVALVPSRLAPHPSDRVDSGAGEPDEGVRYRVTRDSTILVDAWWGSQQFGVEGELALHSAVVDASEVRTHRLAKLVLELTDDFGRPAGRVVFNGPSTPGLVRCTSDGAGMLGASVRIEGLFATGSESLVADHAATIWMELPITLSRRRGMIGSTEALPAQNVFPVDPEFADRLEAFPQIGWPFDGALQDDDSGFMPCERVDGLTIREWRWLQRIRLCFPQCFTGA